MYGLLWRWKRLIPPTTPRPRSKYYFRSTGVHVIDKPIANVTSEKSQVEDLSMSSNLYTNTEPNWSIYDSSVPQTISLSAIFITGFFQPMMAQEFRAQKNKVIFRNTFNQPARSNAFGSRLWEKKEIHWIVVVVPRWSASPSWRGRGVARGKLWNSSKISGWLVPGGQLRDIRFSDFANNFFIGGWFWLRCKYFNFVSYNSQLFLMQR